MPDVTTEKVNQCSCGVDPSVPLSAWREEAPEELGLQAWGNKLGSVLRTDARGGSSKRATETC